MYNTISWLFGWSCCRTSAYLDPKRAYCGTPKDPEDPHVLIEPVRGVFNTEQLQQLSLGYPKVAAPRDFSLFLESTECSQWNYLKVSGDFFCLQLLQKLLNGTLSACLPYKNLRFLLDKVT